MADKFYTKAQLAPGSGDYVSFIASDESVDRAGDIVRQNWVLDNFKANPTILWGHDASIPPIGRAHNVRVEGGKLKADIEFVPEEVDGFGARIGRLVKAGFVRAVSVGFRPLESRPIKSGYEFLKNELLEISCVATPCNQNALVFAKSFMQDEEISRVFAADPEKVRLDRAKAAWLLAQHKYGVIA